MQTEMKKETATRKKEGILCLEEHGIRARTRALAGLAEFDRLLGIEVFATDADPDGIARAERVILLCDSSC